MTGYSAEHLPSWNGANVWKYGPRCGVWYRDRRPERLRQTTCFAAVAAARPLGTRILPSIVARHQSGFGSAAHQAARVTFAQPVSDETFYRDLPAFDTFANVCDGGHYHDVPDDWDLVITDVEGSTKYIEAGRYKEVNAAGVASIVVVRNCMKDVDIPFVFGGDGATLMTPASRREALLAALRGLRVRCRDAYDLSMRVGVVPISQLKEAGHDVAIARFAASPDVSFAMLRGEGIDAAENWVKDPARTAEFHVSEEGESFDIFDGFECRWKPIPSQHGLVASIIVKALNATADERNAVYTRVLSEIGGIAALPDEGRPIALKTLKMLPGKTNFDSEAILKTGSADSEQAVAVKTKIRKHLRNGKILFATGITAGGFNPKQYKSEMVANTDFRKFDNVLRMHLDLRRGQLDRLKQVLQQAEDVGQLVYGIHTATETLMTCVVDSYQGSHAHFVDGAAGGYALAAKRIKSILKDR